MKCEGVRVVKSPSLFRRSTLEVKDEWEDAEVEGNGGLKVEEVRSLHAWMT